MKSANFSIRSKLSLLSLILVMLVTALTALSFYSYNYIQHTYQKVKYSSVPDLIALFEAKNACRRSFICVEQFLETGDSNNIDSFVTNLQDFEVRLTEYENKSQKNTGRADIKKIILPYKADIEQTANVIFDFYRKSEKMLLELDNINNRLDITFMDNAQQKEHQTLENVIIESKNLYTASVSIIADRGDTGKNTRKKKIYEQLEQAKHYLQNFTYTSRNNEHFEILALIEKLFETSTQVADLDQRISAEEIKLKQNENDSMNILTWAIIYENDDLARQTNAVARLIEFSKISLVVLTIIFTVLALVISRYFSKKIIDSISSLVESTKIMARGNLNHRTQIKSRDEIGTLAESFNKMAEELVKQTASVDNLNREMVERKKAEEMLREANEQLAASNQELMMLTARLEKANSELKDFVYIASHDLREPLRKISSFGSILKESLENKLDPDNRENLRYMIDGADRMSKMIEGLLTYSRVSSKEAPLEEVDLNEVVEQLKQIELAKLIEETAAQIDTPERLPKIFANAAQIRQLLQNLVANGIKYHSKDVRPHITIRTTEEHSGEIRIEVQDNGIGIEEKYFKDIFKMFRRLHSRREYEGTGIGLSVCKKIVEKHNGKIGVISKPGEGSTFWFTLPVKDAGKNEHTELVLSSAE